MALWLHPWRFKNPFANWFGSEVCLLRKPAGSCVFACLLRCTPVSKIPSRKIPVPHFRSQVCGFRKVKNFDNNGQFFCSPFPSFFIPLGQYGSQGKTEDSRDNCLFVGCLTSQQHVSVSQGQICSDNFTCCHTDRSCRSNFPSHPVTEYWHWANQSQHWPYNTRYLAG